MQFKSYIIFHYYSYIKKFVFNDIKNLQKNLFLKFNYYQVQK